MSAALDRWLTRLYRAVGGLLFLALCGVVAYNAGDRSRAAGLRIVPPAPEAAPGEAPRRAPAPPPAGCDRSAAAGARD